VRHVSLVLVLALVGTAHADDDDSDPIYTPVASHSFGVELGGHATRIGGVSETGWGMSVEAALGVNRWQPFAEAMFASVGVGSWNMPASETTLDGWMGRGGLGVRWIARQFEPDPDGAIELYLQALAGIEKFWWHDGGRLTRPDFGVGMGTQVRAYHMHGFTFRIDARIMFTPSDRDGLWVTCRGSTCPPSGQNTSSTGFMTGIGVAF
jgi:hypothetical protein